MSSKQKSFSAWVEKAPVCGWNSFSGEGDGEEEEEVPDSSLEELLMAGFVGAFPPLIGEGFLSADLSWLDEACEVFMVHVRVYVCVCVCVSRLVIKK